MIERISADLQSFRKQSEASTEAVLIDLSRDDLVRKCVRETEK